MTPERWQRVEELYHEARAREPGARAAFLTAACPDDAALRREVESLLREPDSQDGFLAEPVVVPVAATPDDPVTSHMTGRSIGGYHLEKLLGAGGMGEVYRARDTKLGRDVAIKILPQAFTRHPDRLARFEREARMLAALNHPNICAIYGTEEADGIRLLVLELVEGETLADTLVARAAGRTPDTPGLPLPDALAVARQIADALEVAHEKGIIHRDLKPANVKLTPEGVVKVLDFGLAKAVGGDGSAPDLTLVPDATGGARREGAVLGTAAYMSPEQARGLAVDRRTDIWAFGCVLYEMVTGRAAFAGETVSDVIAKVLEREPDWSALPVSTPALIRRLLRLCLAKDARQRLRDIGDARLEIDAVRDVPPDAASDAVAPSRPGARAAWLPWAVLAAFVTATGVWVLRDRTAHTVASLETRLARAQFTRFTDWEGAEAGADISPDGRFVAFIGDRDGLLDIWRGQVGSHHAVNLTAGKYPIRGHSTLLRGFGFSGDGSEIWLSESGGQSGPKSLMPIAGGTPRPFLAAGANAPAWSHDGTRLAFMTMFADAGDSLSVADGSGGDAREIVGRETDMHNHNPAWSPDGRWIYFVRGLDPTNAMDVWRIRPEGGVPERMTRQNAVVNFIAVLDARTLLYTARAEDWSGPWLWALDVNSRIVRRVTVGLEHYTSVAASRDGRRIVATVASPTASLWRVPLGTTTAAEADATPYPQARARALAPRFGGAALYYLSNSGVGDGLWRIQDGQSIEMRQAADGALVEPPIVARDGSKVAVIIRKDGSRRLTIMAADGTDARSLAASISVRGTADWSPDGDWIVTGGEDATQGRGLFLIPADGRPAARLVSGQAFHPVWSPAGDLIVYTALDAGQVPLLGVRPDGSALDLSAVRVRPGGYRFLPDGSGLVYLPHRQAMDFWLYDFATKRARQLTRLENRGSLQFFDVTPDGRQIVFDRSRENSDIVLIDLEK